jgi:predicted DNA binding CopG/RHH family protein
MPADAFIQIRVTPELKARLRGLAEREQIAESALVRQLLVTMLRVQEPTADFKPKAAVSVLRDSRLYVRLRPEDQKLLKARALARGVPSATYIALLVRSHLHLVPPIPEAELLAVKQSISELRSIGRDLNTMARAISRGGGGPQPGQRDALRLMKVGEVLRDGIKALYVANIKSWETGNAETPRSP